MLLYCIESIVPHFFIYLYTVISYNLFDNIKQRSNVDEIRILFFEIFISLITVLYLIQVI